MANLNETDLWEEGVYQLEEDDPVLGGPTGIDNKAPRQLANRARYQRLRNVTPWDAAFTYPANVAYVSYGGTTWKSVGESLNITPGTDAAKWVRWGFTLAELNAETDGALAAHEAKSNPHPQYATDVDLATHVADANPHPLYATDADLAAHVADANPHPLYATDADLAAHAAAANPHTQYVRHDAAQGLTVGQKLQARDNIEAVGLSQLGLRGLVSLNASGNFTVPAGIYVIDAQGWAGGGGGGGSGGGGGTSGGGGGGGYSRKRIAVTPGQVIAYTIGTGGPGGGAGGSGTSGTTTSFGAFFTAQPGIGGTLNPSGNGGAGGIASGGDVNMSGGSAGTGSASNVQGGAGGAAGGGGGGGSGGAQGNAASGGFPGGGGGGGGSAASGGAGGAGLITVSY